MRHSINNCLGLLPKDVVAFYRSDCAYSLLSSFPDQHEGRDEGGVFFSPQPNRALPQTIPSLDVNMVTQKGAD